MGEYCARAAASTRHSNWANALGLPHGPTARSILAIVVAASCLLFGLPTTAEAQADDSVAISEILASNQNGITDEDGTRSDWIELYNPTNATVDIGGWSLTDSLGAAGSWSFPDGQSIGSGDYVVVFASAKDRAVLRSELHTDFKLSAGGEYLALHDAAGELVDEFAPSYPPQSQDISWGIAPDGDLDFFVEPSPGAANDGPTPVSEVEFSEPHGFYDSTISLRLTTREPGSTIRYSLDGSDPTNGQVYNGAITISSTQAVRAVARTNDGRSSRIATQTYLFLDDVIEPNSNPPGFPTSSINGQVFDWPMDPDIVNGNRAAVIDSLQAIPTISLVTDLDHLFEPATGIYVNAAQDGRDWERPASFEVIDPTGAGPGVDANAGIRIRGGYSRRANNPKHSFRIFFRSDYGDAALEYPLFGDDGVDRFDKIDLRSAQNYAWSGSASNLNHQNTMLRERWSRETQAAMGQPYTRGDYYHLYLNGHYFGVVQTQERISKDYAQDYLGGDDNDYDVVKHDRDNGYRVTATDGTLDAWQSLWPLVQDQNVSDSDFATIAEQVDLTNLADYYLVHFYSGDFDGPTSWFLGVDGKRWAVANNWYATRHRNGGQWQFFDHDSEHSLCIRVGGPSTGSAIDNTNFVVGGANPRWNADYFNPAWLHHALLSHPNYRQVFADQAQLHLLDAGGALTTPVARARISELAATVGPAVLAHSARWGDTTVAAPRTVADWQDEVNYLRNTCLAERWSVVQSQLAADNLMPTVAPPTFDAVGAVASGTDVTIAGPNGSTIVFTTDGSDPRGTDRQPSPGAVQSSTVTIDDYVTVTARARVGNDWSAPRTATYELTSLPADPVVLLNEYNAVGRSGLLGNGAEDEALGRVLGNGGDWFELVVLDQATDLRGWQFEILDTKSGELAVRDTLQLTTSNQLSDVPKGTIITVSEERPDDLSYNPPAGDWSINLQANDAGDGAFFTSESQANFDTNEHDWQLVIRDSTGAVRTLRTGEGAGALTGVNATDVGKLEAAPNSAITPDSAYDDGTSSTFGLPNRWDDQIQDLLPVRYLPGDADGSLGVEAADVHAILDANVELPGVDIDDAAADLNNDGQVDLLDALILAQILDGP